MTEWKSMNGCESSKDQKDFKFSEKLKDEDHSESWMESQWKSGEDFEARTSFGEEAINEVLLEKMNEIGKRGYDKGLHHGVMFGFATGAILTLLISYLLMG